MKKSLALIICCVARIVAAPSEYITSSLKGTLSRDFQPQVFFHQQIYLGSLPSDTQFKYANFVQKLRAL
jgi:hypothetical protein